MQTEAFLHSGQRAVSRVRYGSIVGSSLGTWGNGDLSPFLWRPAYPTFPGIDAATSLLPHPALPLPKVIRVDALEAVGTRDGDTQVRFDHVLDEFGTVDEDTVERAV
jgi:hypothetical protein